MKKIPTMFMREEAPTTGRRHDLYVLDVITPGCEWIAAGEGVATRKHDGTCCLVRGGTLFKRYDAKHGKTPPPGFEPAQDPDPVTGHWPGWISVGDGPNDWMHREAWQRQAGTLADGTYELVGPKVNGNPDGYAEHTLVRHGIELFDNCPRDFAGLAAFLAPLTIEGIVFHHPDGRMAKIKRKDFRRTP